MNNKVLIELNEIVAAALKPFIEIAVKCYLEEGSNVVTRDTWGKLSVPIKKYLVLAKCKEVYELYPNSPLYGAYEDIYISLVEENEVGTELEHRLECFAKDVIFLEYSDKELEEMIKHYPISTLD